MRVSVFVLVFLKKIIMKVRVVYLRVRVLCPNRYGILISICDVKKLKMQIIEADPLEKNILDSPRFPTSPDGRLIKCCHGLARRFSHRVMYFIPISFEYCISFHSKSLVTLTSNQCKHVRGLELI